MTSVGTRGAGLPHKNILKKLVPFHFKTMIRAHIYTHILTYYGMWVQCCAWIHTCWNIIKQLLNYWIPRETQDFLIIFFIYGTQIKGALFIAETFNSYFTNVGPTLAEINPHSPKSYDGFMPRPPPCSFGLLSSFSLEIIQISWWFTKKLL